jgi:hypothetical protein
MYALPQQSRSVAKEIVDAGLRAVIFSQLFLRIGISARQSANRALRFFHF